MRSVRARLTAVATVILGIVLLVAAVLIIMLVELQLRGDLTDGNVEIVDELAVEIERGIDPRELEIPRSSNGTEFVIIDTLGNVVNSRPEVETTDLGEGLNKEERADAVKELLDVEPAEEVSSTWPTPLLLQLSFLDVVIFDVLAPDGTEYEIHALNTLDVVEQAVGHVRTAMIVAIPMITLLFGFLVWWVAGHMLKPITDLTARADQIRTDTLGERLQEPGTGDEVDRLARTLNSMLTRLDHGVKAQQQFVSDASHELRSPLTLILGEAELARSSPSKDRLLVANEKAIEHGEQMRDLISDLLELAMADEEHLNHREVDLDDIVRMAIVGHVVEIDDAAVEHIRILGDAAALQRVVRNLVENATRHASNRIEISCRAVGRVAEIVVDDDGPGVSPAFRPHIFRRFSRLDESRQRATGGTGLGLAIAAAIVESHGGTIEVGDAPGLGGARFTVRLPLNRNEPAMVDTAEHATGD